jgi:hypothetical protein
VKVRKSAVKNSTGIVNFTVTNQVNVGGRHAPILPAAKLVNSGRTAHSQV